MVPLAKFDISLKNTPPRLVPFCTESWQRDVSDGTDGMYRKNCIYYPHRGGGGEDNWKAQGRG